MMFFSTGGRIPMAAAEGMWKLIKKQPVSEAEVAEMFLDSKFVPPGRVNPGNRYYSSDRFGGAADEALDRAVANIGQDVDESDDNQQPRRSGYSRVSEILRRRRRRIDDADDRPAAPHFGDYVAIDPMSEYDPEETSVPATLLMMLPAQADGEDNDDDELSPFEGHEEEVSDLIDDSDDDGDGSHQQAFHIEQIVAQ
jgi:hypothetical protein